MNTTHQQSQHFLLDIELSNSSVYIISLRATAQLDTYRSVSLHDSKKPEGDLMSNIIAIVLLLSSWMSRRGLCLILKKEKSIPTTEIQHTKATPKD